MLAGIKKAESPGAVSAVVFRLNDEFLALKTVAFLKALEMRPIHRVPFRTNHVFRGVVNVDGVLLPCISAAELMGISAADPSGKHDGHQCYRRLMVITREGARFVFPVDEVLGVIRVLPNQMQKPPETVSKSLTALTMHVFPWENRMVGLLDDQKLFTTFHGSLTH